MTVLGLSRLAISSYSAEKVGIYHLTASNSPPTRFLNNYGIRTTSQRLDYTTELYCGTFVDHHTDSHLGNRVATGVVDYDFNLLVSCLTAASGGNHGLVFGDFTRCIERYLAGTTCPDAQFNCLRQCPIAYSGEGFPLVATVAWNGRVGGN